MAPHTGGEVHPETDTSPPIIPDRFTVQSIAKRRAASGKLVAGIGAAADVKQFKSRPTHLYKGKAKRWDRMYQPRLSV